MGAFKGHTGTFPGMPAVGVHCIVSVDDDVVIRDGHHVAMRLLAAFNLAICLTK